MAEKKDQQKGMFFEDDSSSSSTGSTELLCDEKVDMRDVQKRRKIEHDTQQNARKPVFFGQQKRFYFNKKPKESNKDKAKKDVAQQDSDATKPKKAAVSRNPPAINPKYFKEYGTQTKIHAH